MCVYLWEKRQGHFRDSNVYLSFMDISINFRNDVKFHFPKETSRIQLRRKEINGMYMNSMARTIFSFLYLAHSTATNTKSYN
jgi:hypothetical protein